MSVSRGKSPIGRGIWAYFDTVFLVPDTIRGDWWMVAIARSELNRSSKAQYDPWSAYFQTRT
jgi:hypothetical protein